MRGRGAAAIASLLLVVSVPVSAALGGDSDPGIVAEPDCRFRLTAARESHGARYSTRCNFEQFRIRVASDSRIYDVDIEPRLSGQVDAGDEIRCRVPPVSDVATCSGSAGSGVRVGGYLETEGFHCDVATRIRVIGGPDCAPDAPCPEIAYVVRRNFEQPTTCGGN